MRNDYVIDFTKVSPTRCAHKPQRRPRHGDDSQDCTRRLQQRSEADGWVDGSRSCCVKPPAYHKTGSLDSPSDTPDALLLGSLHRSGRCEPQVADLQSWAHHFPHIREHRCIVCIFLGKPMHLLAEPLVILRLWMNQRIEGINYFSSTYNHHAYAAHARRLLIGRLEIYCCKIFHTLQIFPVIFLIDIRSAPFSFVMESYKEMPSWRCHP